MPWICQAFDSRGGGGGGGGGIAPASVSAKVRFLHV